MTSTNNTIKFNVGGKHFEVSRDLIEAHSETMLGKIVSEAWQADPEEAVFIDRNGDIFAYVLDYLRYGSIELPPNVPKASFERDLDFYGIVPEEGGIKGKTALDLAESLRKDLNNAQRNLDNAKVKNDMLLLAADVHNQVVKHIAVADSRNYDKYVTVKLNDFGHSGDLSRAEKDILMNYLNEYFGLSVRMATKSECGYDDCARVDFYNGGRWIYVIRK